MSLYSRYILPRVIDSAMKMRVIEELRPKVVEKARGTVLEIGFGSGLNLAHYREIESLYALEPSVELFQLGLKNRLQKSFEFFPLQAGAECIPLPSEGVDTVVSTFTACSIPEIGQAFREIFRVLKPDGVFLFLEHGLSSRPIEQRLQHFLTPVSRCLGGGCHLNRDVVGVLIGAGFEIEDLERFSLRHRPLMEIYRGAAVKPVSN